MGWDGGGEGRGRVTGTGASSENNGTHLINPVCFTVAKLQVACAWGGGRGGGESGSWGSRLVSWSAGSRGVPFLFFGYLIGFAFEVSDRSTAVPCGSAVSIGDLLIMGQNKCVFLACVCKR